MNTPDIHTEAMIERWTSLFNVLGEKSEEITKGRLTVLGSGISHADIIAVDSAIIGGADKVFYCTYDRVTEAWIHDISQDPYDLRVLYSKETDRHTTYICMAEAMLHYVRRGCNVVAVYYGHPGMFATATHRAVKIARREGHVAAMRPGLSALDHLIADVGFDPMIPGMISYEASELLLSNRALYPELHTVIWQVGMVGDFGYDPAGFKNPRFQDFVEILEAAYGMDGEVVLYIAPQYVGIKPLIERTTIRNLLDESTREFINSFTTMYLPPSIVDPRMREDGTPASAGRRPAPANWKSYDLAGYTELERRALVDVKDWKIPKEYRTHVNSPAAKFIRELTNSPAMLADYVESPERTLSTYDTSGMTSRAVRLLCIPHPSAFNAAIAEERERDE